MKLKRLFFIIIMIFISLIQFPFNATAQEDESNLVGIATSASVNVRSKPNGSIIANLLPNVSVSVLGKSDNGKWLSVQLADGRTGWVSAPILRVMQSAVPADLVPITPDNADQLENITQLTSALSSRFTFSTDGRLIASYSWLGNIEIYDVRTKILITKLTKHTDIVSDVAFSPDGTELASSSWDGSVKIWNLQTWGERTSLQGHSDGVQSVAYSPDGKLLASVAEDGLLIIWNPQTGERVRVIKTGSRRIRRVIFSPDGTKIATAGDAWDSIVSMWDVATGGQLWTRSSAGNLQIAFTFDGLSLAVATGDLTITGMNPQTAQQTFEISSAGGSPASIALNSADTLVAVGTWRGAFIVADVEKKKVLFTNTSLKDSADASVVLSFSPDGRLLVTSDGDHGIYLWGVHGSH